MIGEYILSKIHELSPHVADLIAAGEVVERPGSVVKELVENAIDAGATALTVEIKAGGMTYTRVTDNGCGMGAEDAARAFLRHATSKISGEHDLECIGTLGFRGEALAAISAVSRISLLTREKGAPEGTGLTIEGGEIADLAPAGCPEGTTIIIRDLFFNTPARLKFMKSDRAEGANVSQIMLRCAMSHPEISMRYIKDGKEEFHTPGDGSVRSCVYTLLGREFASNLLEVRVSEEDMTAEGFVTTPAAGRGNRAYQFFFINGRYVKSPLLQAALEQAYKNSIFSGKFPSCVLYITLKLGAVDVNVHPTKTEVKFLQEKKVFDGVYYSVLSALEKSDLMPELSLTGRLKVKSDSEGQTEHVGQDNPRQETSAAEVKSAKYTGKEDTPGFITHPELSGSMPVNDSLAANVQMDFKAPPAAGYLQFQVGREPNEPVGKEIRREDNESLTQTVSDLSGIKETGLALRIVGEAMGTYIIVEDGDRLVLIDKHAAHERILFDALQQENYDPMPQRLISPIVVDLGPEDTQLMLDNTDLLTDFGFEIDAFGQDCVAIRQIPGNIESGGMDKLLADICQKLKLGHKLDPASVRDDLLHTIACKAAIKAGLRSDPTELYGLVDKVLSGRVKYCPHGRPVSMEITKSNLDKNFKRA